MQYLHACITAQLVYRCTAIVIIFIPYSFILLVAGAPTNITASRTGYTSVLVSWSAPSPPPASYVYEVFYQTSAGDHTRLSGGNTSNTELTLTGLTLGETYWIFVVAFGKEGAPVLPSIHSAAAITTLCEFMHVKCKINKYIFNNFNSTVMQLLKSHN